MKGETKIIFQGVKAYLKANLAVTVVEHVDYEITEVIMHDATLDTEAPRIYFRSSVLFAQLEINDIEEQLKVAEQNGLSITDKFIDGIVSKSKADFILSRLAITTYSAEVKKVCVIFQTSGVIYNSGALLCEKPMSLQAFNVMHGPTRVDNSGVEHASKVPARPVLRRAKARRGSLFTMLRRSFQMSSKVEEQQDGADGGDTSVATITAEQRVVQRWIASFGSVAAKAGSPASAGEAPQPPQSVQCACADSSLLTCTADNSHTEADLHLKDLSQHAVDAEPTMTTNSADVSSVSAKKLKAHRKRSFISSFFDGTSSSQVTPPSSTKHWEPDNNNLDKVSTLQRFMSVLTNWRSSNKIYADSTQD